MNEIDELGAVLADEAKKAVGAVADDWSDGDREVLKRAALAVAAVAFNATPEQEGLAKSIVKRLASIGAHESGKAAESFLKGALEVLKVAAPLIIRAVAR